MFIVSFIGSQSLLHSTQAMPKESHAFLGRTKQANHFRQAILSSFLEQEAELQEMNFYG